MYMLWLGYLFNELVNVMVVSSLIAWICIALIWAPCEAARLATVVERCQQPASRSGARLIPLELIFNAETRASARALNVFMSDEGFAAATSGLRATFVSALLSLLRVSLC
jgi:hypothetical protein